MDATQPQILEIDMRTAYGRLKARLAVPPNPIRLSELAFSFLSLDGRLIDMAAAADRKGGHQVSCRKGCSACCQQIVPLSPAEAWMIADMVRSLPLERRTSLLERFTAIRSRLQGADFGQRFRESTFSLDRIAEMSLAYQGFGMDCPFLEDHACSIHPDRPTICREFLATTPAEWCAEPGRHAVRTVPLAASFTECLSKVSAMVMGGEPQVIPLSLALDWAETNREAGRRRYDPAALMAAMFHFMSPPDEDVSPET